VYLSRRVATVLHVCAADKGDGISLENEFHNAPHNCDSSFISYPGGKNSHRLPICQTDF